MRNKKRPNYKFAMAKIAGIASAIDYDPSSQPANIHDEAMREIKRIAHEALGDPSYADMYNILGRGWRRFEWREVAQAEVPIPEYVEEPRCDNAGCLNSESGFGRKYCKACWDKQNPGKCFYCKGKGVIFSSGQEVSDCSHCKEQRPEPLDMDAINEMYDQPNGGLYFP